jgi:hypothetical protein
VIPRLPFWPATLQALTLVASPKARVATNSHHVPVLANLVENCFTNIVKECCQVHSING